MASCKEQIKYAVAGSIAEEVFTAIRTVTAFGLEKQVISRYVYLCNMLRYYLYFKIRINKIDVKIILNTTNQCTRYNLITYF